MIRHVPDSHIIWTRRGLKVRYGYSTSSITVWGDWRWTHRAARRELMDALEQLGL